MTPRARALVIAAVLGLPATVYADTDDAIRLFTSSKYTYCDAKLLAGLWQQSVADAKATIGRKVGGGNPAAIERALVGARKRAARTRLRCSYQEAGLTYDDAERLAKLWKRSVTDAKAMIEAKLLTGGVDSIRELLNHAPAHAELAVFLRQDRYTYCDAKLIAALWNQSVGDAKTYIGTKSPETRPSRSTARWRRRARTPTARRRPLHVRRGRVLVRRRGQAREAVEPLDGAGEGARRGQARRRRRAAGARAARRADRRARDRRVRRPDRYGYCDAKALAVLWKQSVHDAKATIGAKLQRNNTAALDRALASARANARRTAAARCSFGDAFTYQDAVKLAKLWRVTVADAKARVEAKLVAGGEQYVRAQLATGPDDGGDRDLATFLRQDRYTYCDAKMPSRGCGGNRSSARRRTSAASSRAATPPRSQHARRRARPRPAGSGGALHVPRRRVRVRRRGDAREAVADHREPGEGARRGQDCRGRRARRPQAARAVIGWTIGIEVELLAPVGASRRTLAERYAAATGGTVRPFFHPQSELSLVPGVPVFENLTLGFEVRDAAGALVASCVDDLTLQDDLDRERPPVAGWFRVVSDDARLLQLVARAGRADAGPLEALAPVARLFGTEPAEFPGGMVRVTDRNAAPIAIATPLPGERERPCEIVTPPLARDHAARLDALLAPARALGFTVPAEAATHVHFDGAPFRSPRALRDLVRLVAAHADELKALVGTNPRCRRLGGWPAALHEVVEAADFAALAWPEAQARLQDVGLTKYCDVNLKNLVHDVPGKPTIEVRVLPGLIDSAAILEGAALFEGVLRLALAGPAATAHGPLLDRLPLAPELRRGWATRRS